MMVAEESMPAVWKAKRLIEPKMMKRGAPKRAIKAMPITRIVKVGWLVGKVKNVVIFSAQPKFFKKSTWGEKTIRGRTNATKIPKTVFAFRANRKLIK